VTGLSTFDPSSDTVANVTTVQTTVSNSDMRGTDSVPTNPLLDNDARLNNLDATISSRSDFDNSTDEVITDSASRDASKADISSLGTHADLDVINNGVKKSSKLIPHNEDLP
jgi:D-tyrosyl-tRNA(Tyr) deacylase